jgi:AcrR family transcriptional regulator
MRAESSADAPGTVAPVLDPRVARSRDAVLNAARELLVESGPAAVTVDAVVARSGVAKSTIYRHWESRDDLLVSVMECAAPTLEPPPAELGFEASIRHLVHGVGSVFADPDWARMLPALMMLKHHEDGLAHLEDELHQRQIDVLHEVLARGVREGRMPPDYDVDEVSGQLIGPMFFAVVTGSQAVDTAFCDRVVDRFLRAFAP